MKVISYYIWIYMNFIGSLAYVLQNQNVFASWRFFFSFLEISTTLGHRILVYYNYKKGREK